LHRDRGAGKGRAFDALISGFFMGMPTFVVKINEMVDNHPHISGESLGKIPRFFGGGIDNPLYNIAQRKPASVIIRIVWGRWANSMRRCIVSSFAASDDYSTEAV